MFKILKNVISGLRTVKKYGSLAVTLMDITGYAADKLEAYEKNNLPVEVDKKDFSSESM
jgi:uncharacterized protein YbgA (DUF1722 family)